MQEYQSVAHCIGGGCASFATSFIFTPSERIKQQMQVGSHYQNCWYCSNLDHVYRNITRLMCSVDHSKKGIASVLCKLCCNQRLNLSGLHFIKVDHFLSSLEYPFVVYHISQCFDNNDKKPVPGLFVGNLMHLFMAPPGCMFSIFILCLDQIRLWTELLIKRKDGVLVLSVYTMDGQFLCSNYMMCNIN